MTLIEHLFGQKRKPDQRFELSTFRDDVPVIVRCGALSARALFAEWRKTEPTTTCVDLENGMHVHSLAYFESAIRH